ncbi:leucine-rich repeat protein SHOC-2 [Chrysoperla carnea]|uniref:leucine-rich repeat protein SHOC-2 n=1 Tax=Chrysoperla carnea TaxID=189513 RepID=UPI001D0604DE|nr:leucine-rich repeat protein SHOC-2 [Chrysoperla carnea]
MRKLSFILIATIMSTFLYSLLGITVGMSLHCAVRKEIDPCTCRKEYGSQNIYVKCERMISFDQVINALQNHFTPDDHITLEITFSNLTDMGAHKFEELKVLHIQNLRLLHDNLRNVTDDTFLGLNKIDFLSLADNDFTAIPKDIFSRMPTLKSLDFGRGHITQILEDDFVHTINLHHLLLPGNMINMIEKNSMPRTLRHLHLGRNQIPDLNGTLRNMHELEWLFINANQLTTLDGQLPDDVNNLVLIHASDNYLQHLPQEFKNLHRIKTLFFEHNKLLGLDGALAKSKKLQLLVVSHNNIQTITPDDFAEAESLEDLQMGYNNITAINGSLSPLRSLRCVNLTHNLLSEFSLQEIRGLRRLRLVDLSHNKISNITGRMENVVELETRVMDLKLDYNELHSLDGALSGLHGLKYLNLSHNHLTKISPDDLIGLEDLIWVDFSHNKLTTLDETSKTFLPSLERLFVNHNMLTELQHDFFGLPILCFADLSYNNIRTISRELVAHTRCNIHGSPGILGLNLEDNPVLCDSALPELISDLEVNNTRIYGTTQCIPSPLPVSLAFATSNNNSNIIEITPLNATNMQYLVENTDASSDQSENIVPEIHLEPPKTIIHHSLTDTENPKHVRTVD